MFHQPRNVSRILSEKNVYLVRVSMVQYMHGTLTNFLQMIVNQLTTSVQRIKKTKTLKPKDKNKKKNIYNMSLIRPLGSFVTQSSAYLIFQISINLLQGIMVLK